MNIDGALREVPDGRESGMSLGVAAAGNTGVIRARLPQNSGGVQGLAHLIAAGGADAGHRAGVR